jgi:hypothetical protein
MGILGTWRKDKAMRACVRSSAAAGLACCLLLAGAGLVLGQETVSVRKVSAVVGASVSLEQGGRFGKVEDLVLNDDGCVEFVIVSYEDEYIAVPWAVATVNFGERVIRLDLTRERLREIPTFRRERWPDFARGEYRDKLHKVFGDRFERRGRRSEDNAERRNDRREERRDQREGDRNRDRVRPPERPDRNRATPPEDRRERPGTRPPQDREPPRTPADRNRPPDRPADRPPRDRGNDRPPVDRP